jgi:hypothetical protein
VHTHSRLRTLIAAVTLTASGVTACSDSALTTTESETDTGTNPPITTTPAASVSCFEAGVNTTPFTVANAMSANTADHELASDYLYNAANVVPITLNGASATVVGSGVSISGSTVTITAAGTYSLTGTLNDGQVLVTTSDTGAVRVIMNGASLTSTTNAPFVVTKAKRAVVLLAAGTTNRVTDGATYPSGVDQNAALFSKANMSIGGTGALIVTGRFEDGIASKDGLVIADGNITVVAKDDGIRGKDYLVIRGGTFTVTSGGDGIKSNEDEDAKLGYVRITGGTFNITSAGDAVSAETDALIAGGTIVAKAAGGSTARISDTLSAKGIKGGVIVVIDSGTMNLDTADDGLHSNARLIVNGGKITIATGDDGIHSDSLMTINAGTIDITKSYEGIETGAADLVFNGGNIHITASDDGVNLAGNGDTRPSAGAATLYSIRFNGGRIAVNASGDGVDSNASIEMTGGCVIVNGPTANNNAPLDYDGAFKITGGFFVATGSSGMAQAPGSTSTQAGTLLVASSSKAAGTLIHIQNAAGETILDFAPAKAFQSIAFSAPKLAVGTSYSLFLGGSSSGTATDGWYQGGTYSGGTLAKTFTISSVVNRVTF